MQNVLLDFELSPEQLQALNFFAMFKQHGHYDQLQYEKADYDQVQTWFQVQYNDNTYDVEPSHLELIKEGQVIKKVKISNNWSHELTIPEYSGEEYQLISFIVPKKLLL